MVEVDVKQLLYPGEYVYAHSLYGEIKTRVSLLNDERFWVVEVLPNLVVGSIFKTGSRGLYASNAKALDAPTAAPPASYKATEFVLAVPSSFRNAEPIVVLAEKDEADSLNVTLTPRIVKQSDGDLIVVRIKAKYGTEITEIEEWWRQGTGVVRRLFVTPPLGEMRLLARNSLG